ncbi:hypothetical protein C2G38_2174050 [Gigaspora rosea]|uniref:Protein kinase domain-containing protein n=1 Tax=Gigaspora rosea TaxID=44941 RepID=A0A397VIX2_9GLOM|nr:hypothetical protein C2G38_2174050 [Gigaspora rosea]
MSRANIFVTIVATIQSLSEEPNKLSGDEEVKLYEYLLEKDTRLNYVETFLNLCETNNDKLLYLKKLSVLSVPKTHSFETKSTTKAAMRKIPNMPALEWNDFLTNAFYASTVLDSDNRFSRPNVTKEWLSVEESVVDMFLKTIEATNNQRLILLPTPECWSRSYASQAVKGHPHVIRCGAGNIQLLYDPEASLILSIVEVKSEQLMRTLVADGTELFNAYNIALTAKDDRTTAYTRHQKIIKIVRQLFGYMVVNDLKYGLLTTYIRTCKSNCTFFTPNTDDGDNSDDEDNDDEDKNDKDRDIGDKYKDKDRDKDDEYQASSSNKNILKRTLGVITRNQSKKRKVELNDNEFLNSMKNYKHNQFSFGDVLGNGRSGIIFIAKFHEQVGALKMVDLYKKEYLLREILNEIKMYLGPFKEIQEIYIPKLLKYGVLHEVFAFLLTSFAGESFADIRNITEKEKQLAIDGLLAIHAKEVKHGDIRLENIVIERNELTGHSNVRWIDFAWSKLIKNAKNLDKELSELKCLLGVC